MIAHPIKAPDKDFTWGGGHDRLVGLADTLCMPLYARTHARRGPMSSRR